jgi:hypothetical protein
MGLVGEGLDAQLAVQPLLQLGLPVIEQGPHRYLLVFGQGHAGQLHDLVDSHQAHRSVPLIPIPLHPLIPISLPPFLLTVGLVGRDRLLDLRVESCGRAPGVLDR